MRYAQRSLCIKQDWQKTGCPSYRYHKLALGMWSHLQMWLFIQQVPLLKFVLMIYQGHVKSIHLTAGWHCIAIYHTECTPDGWACRYQLSRTHMTSTLFSWHRYYFNTGDTFQLKGYSRRRSLDVNCFQGLIWATKLPYCHDFNQYFFHASHYQQSNRN